MTYNEFIQNVLNTRGRFACGDEYHERHHIIPKCMGGTNDEENLVDLFAREHFLAHKLLAQENPNNNSLVYAWGCMAWVKNANQDRYELTPEEYEDARIAFAKAISNNSKERFSNPENNPMYGIHRFGNNNPMYGKCHTEAAKQKISQKQKERFVNPENHPMYGKHHTEKTRQKMRENHADFNGEKHPMYGRKHTEESRKKMGENHRSMRGKGSPLSCVIAQYTIFGEFMDIFDSTGEASRETHVAQSSICRCANGKLKSAGGFIWKYVNKKEEQSSTAIA